MQYICVTDGYKRLHTHTDPKGRGARAGGVALSFPPIFLISRAAIARGREGAMVLKSASGNVSVCVTREEM